MSVPRAQLKNCWSERIKIQVCAIIIVLYLTVICSIIIVLYLTVICSIIIVLYLIVIFGIVILFKFWCRCVLCIHGLCIAEVFIMKYSNFLESYRIHYA